MTLAEFCDRAISVPYLDKGRDYVGWDCWGLIACAFRDVLGVELPSWADAYTTAADREEVARLIDGGKSDWSEVAEPRDLDVALLRDGRTASHVGLIVGGRLLHSRAGADTVLEPLLRWRPRLVGLYRHRG